jgi:hypothetical protein
LLRVVTPLALGELGRLASLILGHLERVGEGVGGGESSSSVEAGRGGTLACAKPPALC